MVKGLTCFIPRFVALVDKTAERNADGPFRLHVERSFVLKGLGTIISGIPCSGSVSVGDTLELLPEAVKKKVKGVQVYGQDSDAARAGECVALKMSDMSKSKLVRGMVLAEPGFFEPTQYVNAKFQLLPGLDRPIKPRTAIRFHTGTTDVPGHLVLPSLDPMKPGEESYVQFQLKRPVVAAPGDFFVVRLLSPVTTIGGGYVVSSVDMKMRRSKGDWVEECREREKAFEDPLSTITYVMEHAEEGPLSLAMLAHKSFMNEASLKEHISELIEKGSVVSLPGERYVHSSLIRKVSDELVAELKLLHDKNPVSLGFPRKDVVRNISWTRLLLDKAISKLTDDGVLESSDSGILLKERAPALSSRQSVMAGKILGLFKTAEFTTPREDELPEMLGAPLPIIKPILDHLVQKGELVRIDDKVILHLECLGKSRELLAEYLKENGSIESGVFRDMLGTTRKYSIPILEYWDGQGLTKRTGNERILR